MLSAWSRGWPRTFRGSPPGPCDVMLSGRRLQLSQSKCSRSEGCAGGGRVAAYPDPATRAVPELRIQQHRNVIKAARDAGAKKLFHTSIIGPDEGARFSPVVQSDRQTEADIRASGLDRAIGRNAMCNELDIDFFDSGNARGEIANSAGQGRAAAATPRGPNWPMPTPRC